jgi:hypothetical protein
MSRHRTVRPRTASALVASLLLGLLVAAPSGAAPSAVTIKPIVFPVDGNVTYTDTFGAPRSGHTHEGQDLMGAKMMKLVSAVDGTVFRVVFNNATGNSVTIKAADGWTYHYIHVNNDTPGTDDGQATRAQAFPASIVPGAVVTKGQLIAFMGDSGNAESAGAHLHFEIREPAPPGGYIGTAINPYASLQAATKVVHVPAKWYLRSSPTGGPSTSSFTFGIEAGDRALLCDWDADGVDEPVLYRGGTWQLRTGINESAVARQLTFGTAQDTPLCGDVDGDGRDEPVLFRAGAWTVRTDFAVTSTVASTAAYGDVGDRPVLGDWDGNGADDLGVYRGNVWYLRTNAGASGATAYRFAYGRSTDVPVVGNWDGVGGDEPGIFRDGTWYPKAVAGLGSESLPSFGYGTTGDQPLTGSWTAGPASGIGAYRPSA